MIVAILAIGALIWGHREAPKGAQFNHEPPTIEQALAWSEPSCDREPNP